MEVIRYIIELLVLIIVVGIPLWLIWLKKYVSHFFDMQREKYKADRQEDKAQLSSLFSTMMGDFSIIQQETHKKRIEAVETLWKETLALDDFCEGYKFIYGLEVILTFEEMSNQNEFINFIKNFDYKKVWSNMPDTVKEIWPFINNDTYLLYYYYRSLIGRVVFLTCTSVQNGQLQDWSKDKGIHEILKHILTEEEVAHVLNQKMGKLYWCSSFVWRKMLDNITKILAGEESAVASEGYIKQQQSMMQITQEQLKLNKKNK